MWFTPLFKYLEYFLEQIPQDCHKDQSEGALWAADQLALGKTLHSIDLSNATDKFPYALQRMVLNQIGIPTEIVGLLDEVVRGDWKAPRELNESVRWTVGQPLGLLPSFSMFSLTHHMLVRGVYMKLGIPEDLWDYRILGDDVIIADGRVAALYKEALTQIGVEISMAKSYTSDVYAEFAGYSISPDGSFRPGKFRPASQSNIVDKIRNAVDPTVYVPETLLAKELIDEPYPYGLRPPTDAELERLPFESLLAIHSILKPKTNEWAIEFVLEEFANAFLTTRKESVHRKVEELEMQLALWPKLTHAPWENVNPWYNIPNILADIQYLCLFAEGEPLQEIRDRLQERFQEDMSGKTKLQLCKFIAMMNPSFCIPQGSPNQMKQLNQLHKVLGMQFTANQLARWLS